MQTGARYSAILDLMTEIFKDKSPADGLINAYVRERKYIGSKDRRFITETLWKIIRMRRRLEFEAGALNPRRMLMVYLKDEDLDLIFGADEYAPAALSREEKSWLKGLKERPYPVDVEAECPKWLFDKIKDVELLKALNEPASADLRINVRSREEVIAKLKGEGLYFAPAPYSPIGIRSSERVNLNNCMAYQNGEIDVQDEASQLAAILADAKPDEKIMDYCAGAGGKALTMAYLMNNRGKVQVHDINWGRLEAIKDRSVRLGAKTIEIVKEVTDTDYDLFVVDAPCSGSGTWRRSPDAKFRLTPAKLAELTKTQREILEKAYMHTKPGGRIVYITCSILKDENENVIEAFKSRHPELKHVSLRELWAEKIGGRYPFVADEYARFSPPATGTDGFFLSILQK